MSRKLARAVAASSVEKSANSSVIVVKDEAVMPVVAIQSFKIVSV